VSPAEIARSTRDRKFSLIDVARLLSGKTATDARKDVYVVLGQYEEVRHSVLNLKFNGPGQRETPAADLRTTLLVVLRLRSRVAQRLSTKVVDVFVRYIGGDPELARETLAHREYQEHLALEQPYHPARAFGEAVEAELKEHEPPIVLELFDEAPLLLGAQHLYAMQCVERQGLWKVGVSADPHRRLEEVKTKNGKLNLVLRAVWRHEAGLEAAVLRALDVPPEDEELKELLKSTEFRWTHQDLHRGVKRAVDFARENARLREFLSRTAEVEEPDLKRRRVSLDLDERELCLQKDKLGMEKDKLGMEKDKLGMEKDKLGMEKDKLGMEKDSSAWRRISSAWRRISSAWRRRSSALRRRSSSWRKLAGSLSSRRKRHNLETSAAEAEPGEELTLPGLKERLRPRAQEWTSRVSSVVRTPRMLPTM
jgi:hypothetical protein